MPQKSPPKKKAAGSDEKKVLVGVRVPESFHRRIQSECIRRDQTLQQVVVGALKIYFITPPGWKNVSVRFTQNDPLLPGGVADQQAARMDLWLQYLDSMPPEKIEVLAKAMEWDLQAQKSSRRKSVRRPKPAAGERE